MLLLELPYFQVDVPMLGYFTYKNQGWCKLLSLTVESNWLIYAILYENTEHCTSN